MNNTLIALLVGAVVVAGGGYWYISHSGGEAMEGEQMMEEHESTAVANTFSNIIARGQPVECTFQHDDGVNTSSGTVYITENAGRIRGDFTIVQSQTGPMEMHLVRDAGYNNVWGSFSEQGIKIQVTDENRDVLFEKKDNVAVDETVDYTCTDWNVDDSMFALPDDLQFIDIRAQVDQTGAGQASGDIKATQCAACDQAPGEGREQCRQALGCQ